ncbi:MAG: MCE family protein [Bacteroidota bacterium]
MVLLFAGVGTGITAIYLTVERINGLTTESPVLTNGYEVGQIQEIDLNSQGQITIEVRLDNDPPIPADSEFFLTSTGFFDNQEISIDWGESSDFIQNGDSLTASFMPHKFQSDTIVKRFMNLMEEVVFDQ